MYCCKVWLQILNCTNTNFILSKLVLTGVCLYSAGTITLNFQQKDADCKLNMFTSVLLLPLTLINLLPHV